jgi:PAS domain S-box-containing protein
MNMENLRPQSIEDDERTRIMMDATPMACSIWNANGVMLDCNLEALKIMGLSKKSDYIEHFYDLNPEYQPDGISTREKASALIKQAFDTGYERFEWMYRTASGEALPVETTLVRVSWKGNWHIAAYSRDLREIKAKEAEAKEAEDRMRIMLDTMPFASCFFNVDGRLIDCNQRAVALFGCKDKLELLAKFHSLSPEYQHNGKRSKEQVYGEIRKAFLDGKNVFFWDHLRADGTPLPVEITLLRVQWKNDYRVIGYARDLSVLTETRDNLARITAMVDASPVMSIYLEAQGNIVYMNPAVSAISGWSKEEFSTHGLQLMFSGDNWQQLNQEYIAKVREKRNAHFEVSMNIVTKNGESRTLLFAVFSVRHHSGVALLGRDITELKDTRGVRIQQD